MSTGLLLTVRGPEPVYALFTDRLITYRRMLNEDPAWSIIDRYEEHSKVFVSPDQRRMVGIASMNAPIAFHAARELTGDPRSGSLCSCPLEDRFIELDMPMSILIDRALDAHAPDASLLSAARGTRMLIADLDRGAYRFSTETHPIGNVARIGTGAIQLAHAYVESGRAEARAFEALGRGALPLDDALDVGYRWFKDAVELDPESSGVELTVLRPGGSTRCVLDPATIGEPLGYEDFASSWASKRA